jgi:hypothetical protein
MIAMLARSLPGARRSTTGAFAGITLGHERTHALQQKRYPITCSARAGPDRICVLKNGRVAGRRLSSM